MTKCIIIEDEPLAAERLKDYIRRTTDLQLLACFENAESALQFPALKEVELVFLDVHLGETSGIALLESGALPCKVILTTAYSSYALKGYELDVVDYLLKPFTYDRFKASVERALRKPMVDDAYIFIPCEYRQEKVYLRDVLYIEGMDDYRRFHTQRGKLMTLTTFKELEQTVSNEKLLRIHKSYMVNPNKIQSISYDSITLTDGTKLPIGDAYRRKIKPNNDK